MRRMQRTTIPIALLLCLTVFSVDAFVHHPIPTSLLYPDVRTTLGQAATDIGASIAGGGGEIGGVDKRGNEDDSVEFPPPIGAVDRLARAATFWSILIPIIASYYGFISQLKLQELLGDNMSEEEQEKTWNSLHESGAAKLAEGITNLKGFYVKSAQIVSSRQDLFPQQYTDALSGFTDYLDPMPASLAKAVVKSELLIEGETFEDVFHEFDEIPLGAASVAQVHRAVLTEKYGNREVAVKIQRPSIESKLMGDVANLKILSKTFRDNPNMPLDYYTVFVELEKQLAEEFDFVAEAVAMDRIYNALRIAPDGSIRDIPVVIPRPVTGLVSKRVLVMDFLRGVPLSRAQEEMKQRGIDPDSPEAKLFPDLLYLDSFVSH